MGREINIVQVVLFQEIYIVHVVGQESEMRDLARNPKISE